MSDNIDPYSSKEWKELIGDLKGKHAERMNELLETMTDKEFRIVYPKLLDFAIPKLQKQEIIKSGGEDNNVLRIEIVTRPVLEEGNIIDVTPKEDEV